LLFNSQCLNGVQNFLQPRRLMSHGYGTSEKILKA